MNRNVKLLTVIKSDNLPSVLYDFDFSGLVNAPYALPNKDLGQKKSLIGFTLVLNLTRNWHFKIESNF